jgi:hypothetical protein
LCMMCMNDTTTTIVIGDANAESLHAIWHGEKMTEIREIHRQNQGCAKLNPCKQCALPLDTYDEHIDVGGRTVVAEKYKKGVQKVYELHTPEKFKRKDLKV